VTGEAVPEEVALAGRTLRVDFQSGAEPLLAGGPVYLEVAISLLAGEPTRLVTGAARATGRSREDAFSASTPAGTPLQDPFARAPELGGVQTALQLLVGTPAIERVLLNQFLTLEALRDAVPEGEAADIVIHCSRTLSLEGEKHGDAQAATTDLNLSMRRDDAALSDVYKRAAAEIMASLQFTARREQLVVELTTARNALAAEPLSVLTEHSDSQVSTRAAQALQALTTSGPA